jgi:hypothetical protein
MPLARASEVYFVVFKNEPQLKTITQNNTSLSTLCRHVSLYTLITNEYVGKVARKGCLEKSVQLTYTRIEL